jgi:hypothetical protein
MHQDGGSGVQFLKPQDSLYRRALGEEFEKLPSALRRFHGWRTVAAPPASSG